VVLASPADAIGEDVVTPWRVNSPFLRPVAGNVRARLLAGNTAEIANSSVAVKVVLVWAETSAQLPGQVGDYGFWDGDELSPPCVAEVIALGTQLLGVDGSESAKSGGEAFSGVELPYVSLVAPLTSYREGAPLGRSRPTVAELAAEVPGFCYILGLLTKRVEALRVRAPSGPVAPPAAVLAPAVPLPQKGPPERAAHGLGPAAAASVLAAEISAEEIGQLRGVLASSASRLRDLGGGNAGG